MSVIVDIKTGLVRDADPIKDASIPQANEELSNLVTKLYSLARKRDRRKYCFPFTLFNTKKFQEKVNAEMEQCRKDMAEKAAELCKN